MINELKELCRRTLMVEASPRRFDFGGRLQSAIRHLRQVAAETPAWRPGVALRDELEALADRLTTIAHRVDAPLIIATLGGSGTGKSTLINAIVGDEVVRAGRQRPTTLRPTLICTPDLSPEVLGIDSERVDTIQRDLPSLREFALIDLPDPDTSETDDGPSPGDDNASGHGLFRSDGERETNLDRMRAILPHCDVLLLTATQQKYRSAKVLEEMAAAAAGARILCVQTHGDRDTDIRGDWHALLGNQVVARDEMFFLDAETARQHRGGDRGAEFERLLQTLARQMDRKASVRVRRMNVQRLVDDRFDWIRDQLEGAKVPIEELKHATQDMQEKLAGQRFAQWKADLPRGRSHWESRLLHNVATTWGVSPFQVVLRIFLGLGALLSGAMLLRMRSSMQLAIWGVVEGGRALSRSSQKRRAEKAFERLADTCWNEATLREAAFTLRGYATTAGLDRDVVADQRVIEEAARTAKLWSEEVRTSMEQRLTQLTRRVGFLPVRIVYEVALCAMLLYVFVRPAKNFFYDTVAYNAPLYGLDFYVVSLFWLILWAGFLLWLFAGRARRKLSRDMIRLMRAEAGASDHCLLFRGLTGAIRDVESYILRVEKVEQELRAISSDMADR